MAVVETRISVWEALSGRAPGQPLGPADQGLWTAVAERVNPAKARPTLRAGIEESHLVSARGVAYTMLRSPDERQACYLRLTPEEVELTRLMDGTRTLARLVADFVRIAGRLAPDQVRRVVADLAGNRMLEELPVDAFRPLRKVHRRPWPIRLGRGMLAFVQGRRMVVTDVDPLVGLLYRAGGRLLFTHTAAALMVSVAAIGLVAFGWQWFAGEQSVFLSGDSYAAGAAILLGLNITALACHELGHALAAKHAGRRVPAAGFLVYFGIPSVFVDTTDVWMAGRRARLLTTAAGPATGLVLAGASALVGLAVPAAAPWCFKLSFAWYVNALFNLNPFLALDGYYLLMDWLEVPNLRTRGLAWVAARLRRRPPSWPMLDREGRLIALYGMLAAGWLVVGLNIGYRVYVDRVGGLITGLWRSGWPAQVLLVVVVAALMSPLVYVTCGWLAKRWRRLRQRLGERRVERDAPNRLDALRASSLATLPGDTLAALAARSRWIYPRTGEQLVFAGAAQPHVFAVVEGALEARAPGDPPGTIRERVGEGGVVGVGAAVWGAPSPLAWYAAGTRLLAVPSTALAGAVGPMDAAGGRFGTAAEAQAVFADAPALAGLSHEDRLGLASAAVPVVLAPGATIALNGPDGAIVIVSGSVTATDGQELGRGTVIGPSGEERNGPVGVTRTAVRLFSLPAVSGLPLLLGASPGRTVAQPGGRVPGRPPVFGVHPTQAYAPLAAPPGPPPPVSDDADSRFERRLRWSLILVLLLALLLTGGNVLLPRLAWGEMPTDRALLRADRGTIDAIVAGTPVRLDAGDEVYVGESDRVTVPARSRATMTYRGGAASVLCPGTRLEVGTLVSIGEPVVPRANLTIRSGLVLTDTETPSLAFEPLEVRVATEPGITPPGVAANEGAAWFSVAPWGVVVAEGAVTWNGSPVAPTGRPLACGAGDIVDRPSGTPIAATAPSESPTPPPAATTSLTPSTTPSASPTAPPTTTTGTTRSTTTTTRTSITTTKSASTTTNPPTTSTTPPTTSTAPATSSTTTPANRPPSLSWQEVPSKGMEYLYLRQPCNPDYDYPTMPTFGVRVADEDPASSLKVTLTWDSDVPEVSGSTTMKVRDSLAKTFYGQFGPYYSQGNDKGGTVTVKITAQDTTGLSDTLTVSLILLSCSV